MRYHLIIFYLVFTVFYCETLFCFNNSDIYDVGISRTTIDPSPNFLSVPLAGYYYKAEGRWSLDWKQIDFFNNPVAFTCFDNKFYVTDNQNGLWIKDIHGIMPWKKIGTGLYFISLTVYQNNLYGLDLNSKIWHLSLDDNNCIWVESDITSLQNINSIMSLNGKLYCLANGKLFFLNSGSKEWQNIGDANKIISIAGIGEKIYGFTSDNKLMVYEVGNIIANWQITGIVRDVVGLASSGDKLYIVNKQNEICKSSTLSEGIYVSAVAVRDNMRNIVILVSADLCHISFDFVDIIRTKIALSKNIPKESILINVTHTHFAPQSIYLKSLTESYKPDDDYISFIMDKFESVIDSALANMAPSRIYLGRSITNIGMNRDLDEFYNFCDNTLDILKICNLDNTTKGILYLCGCHPVFSENFRAISSNFVGVARGKIEESIPGCISIFFQGCGGDVNPRTKNYVETGNILAKDVLEFLSFGKFSPISGVLSNSFKSFLLPLRDISNKPKEFIPYKKNLLQFLPLSSYYNNVQSLPLKVNAYVQIINFGSVWKLIGLSGEVTSGYAPTIRNMFESSGRMVSVLGYSNDVSFYIPNKMEVIKNYYEAYSSAAMYGLRSPFGSNISEIYIDSVWNVVMNSYEEDLNNKTINSFKISPNPLINYTTISFILIEASKIEIDIFNFNGQKVDVLVSGYRDKGKYEILWNAINQTSGIYFARILSGNESKIIKLIILKN